MGRALSKGARESRDALGLNQAKTLMRLSYDELIELLGEPEREQSRSVPRASRGSLFAPPPIIIERDRLLWACGCKAKLFSGVEYFVTPCRRHRERIVRSSIENP